MQTKTAKKTTRTKKEIENSELITNAPQLSPEQENKFTTKNKKIILIVIGLLIIAVAYYYRSLFIAATVNGQPISRITLIQELEKQGGKQSLNSLVTKTLILQEAKKQNVIVSSSEVDAEIKKIEENLTKQGQSLDQALAMQGMTKNSLIEQVKIQKMIEKMVGKDIKVTDSEINDYIDKNKDSMPTDKKPEEIKDLVKQQLSQQKMSEKFQTWITDLQKNAKINYLVNY